MYTGEDKTEFYENFPNYFNIQFFVKLLLSLNLSSYQSMKVYRYHNSQPLQ